MISIPVGYWREVGETPLDQLRVLASRLTSRVTLSYSLSNGASVSFTSELKKMKSEFGFLKWFFFPPYQLKNHSELIKACIKFAYGNTESSFFHSTSPSTTINMSFYSLVYSLL